MDSIRSSIEQLLLQIAKEPTSLKTVLDETRSLYEQRDVVPVRVERKKKRKKDKRSVARYMREWQKAARERGDYRRVEDGTIKHQFHKLRREVLRRKRGDNKQRLGSKACWDWNITLDEWLWMWVQCPMVEVGFNVRKPAWEARGRSSKKDVQLKRIDTDKPWEISNLTVIKGKSILYPNSSGAQNKEILYSGALDVKP